MRTSAVVAVATIVAALSSGATFALVRGVGAMDMGGASHAAGIGADTTGDADVDFARDMIVHHRGAVAMAEAQLAEGDDPELLAFARQVIRDQGAEIEMLETWLGAAPR
ncbi:DUF305 domain-containing protein [Jannaschia sp. W003]|uniref:DUF305 domain-containing protein n=1 Tax=Jannaschia sp. W003 TaxID=2867012 RepID=UPI0021A37320|nr:DUF305 domain-containing protein [Jannaschia sp. W003]UWQ22643.1 DUF305 domain-containing protein [Jannaschia sp. W003]